MSYTKIKEMTDISHERSDFHAVILLKNSFAIVVCQTQFANVNMTKNGLQKYKCRQCS